MKLTEENQIRLDNIKRQISVENEYIESSVQYPIIYSSKKNRFGFIHIIPISIIVVIAVSILMIIF